MSLKSSQYYRLNFTITSKPDQLLLRFRPSDTQNGISRLTVKKLAEYLGFTGETQVIHYALCKLAQEVLAAYEADDDELMPMQLAAIRKAVSAASEAAQTG
jgi:hypothetical protein